MKKFIYEGKNTNHISFPLGGIGTGCIGLSGSGRLIDWEIFNKPNKCSLNGYSHFAITAEEEGRVIDARVLNSDLESGYSGVFMRNMPIHSGFGFGPEGITMAGLPHFDGISFRGEYPIAELKFSESAFPASIKLTAFNPFIPLNDIESSLPAAFFEWEIQNTTQRELSYRILLSAMNPIAQAQVINQFDKNEAISSIHMSSKLYQRDDYRYGEVCLATDHEDVSYQEYWFRGKWCDGIETYWRDLTTPGELKNRVYTEECALNNKSYDHSTLAVHIKLAPQQIKRVRFVISWYFPNCYNSWQEKYNPKGKYDQKETWKNYYATQFDSAKCCAQYALNHYDDLWEKTKLFKDTLFESSLPIAIIDAVSANLSTLKTPTTLRLEDGSFYGFEGCIEDSGCCEGSCTHVWNYAYALPFLFPNLERSMRDLDFKYNQREDGRMSFRLQLPLGKERADFRACVDGQMGGVIKAYREWKISGDTSWLVKNWEAIKKSVEYAWSPSNEDQWDYEKTGVLQGRQHHTLDMELFGPNSWLNGFYLAALKAAAEMARFLGEEALAEVYQTIFQKGKEWTNANLFNGEFFAQKLDLTNRDLLNIYGKDADLFGDSTIDTYWNEEADEIKYQIGAGCAIDQVVAQWHANICGLGEIFEKDKVKDALKAIYKYNFTKNHRKKANTWRLFSLNDEGGVEICTWPLGNKPVIPLTYNSETMTGFEYQVAAHMIQEGLIHEGVEIVTAIRQRYDGAKRNPWNEIECGSHYARAMASYSLLLAYSGFEFDQNKKHIGFNPVMKDDAFKSFWCIEGAWGEVRISKKHVIIKVLVGKLKLKSLSSVHLQKVKRVLLERENISFQQENDRIYFDDCLEIKDVLEVGQ